MKFIKFAMLPGFMFLISSCISDKGKLMNPEKPNIVFILIDDLGYKDVGCYGSYFYETPNIDRLAEEGLKFTQSYTASAVCSPSRASILTGKHPGRLHLTDWTGPDEWHPKGKLKTPEFEEDLSKDEFTLVEALKEQGYTSLYIGKWHLGAEDNYPRYHGFDRDIAATNAGAPPSYFYPYIRANWAGTGWPTDIPDLKEGTEGEYLTDRLTSEAVNFLDTINNRPFFLYLSHYGVHKPFEAKKELIEKYQDKAKMIRYENQDSILREKNNSYTRTRQDHAVYAAMIESVDQSLGTIMKKLEELDLRKNTLVVFTSDNGGFSTYNFPLPGEKISYEALATSNLPLRAGKGWYYEGGIKVPTIFSWPGVIKEGKETDILISSADFYPTFLEATGTALIPDQHIDGISFWEACQDNSMESLRNEMYWHYPHYHGSGQKPASSIRQGKYKLIHWIEEDYYELYDLEADPGEKVDLSENLPEMGNALMEKLEEWREEAGVQMPGGLSKE
ncbi:MAG: sulfatase [Bacteroidales bacterium]